MRLTAWLVIGLFVAAALGGCTIQLRPDKPVEPAPPAAPVDESANDFEPLSPPVEPSPDELEEFLNDQAGRVEPAPEPEPIEEPIIEPPALIERNISPMPPQKALTPLNAGRLQAGGRAATTRRRAAISLTIEGHDLLAQNNIYLAEKRFERAVSIDPSCGEAYLALAELRFVHQQWRQATDLATKAALRLARDNYFLARAHLVAAKALVNDEQPDRALAQIDLALAADPSNAESRHLQQELIDYLGVDR